MAVKVIVGSQWGDEGKGKITDILAEHSDLVVRYQGGNNAGHTVCVGESTFKLHVIPSGILYDSCCSVIANGVVVDPAAVLQEIEKLHSQGIEVNPNKLKISSIANVILPYHRILDNRQEAKRHAEKIGTTGKGIGPAYTDKVTRVGIRMQDLLKEDVFRKKVAKRDIFSQIPKDSLDLEAMITEYLEYGQKLAPYLIDSSLFVNQAIDAGKNLIMEGAQGTLLDVDHGTYPFVTSSNPISGGACVGAGIGPHKIDQVVGVTKAYLTRVGEGPFTTELHDDKGEFLRERGGEFGTTTGRPRRCGWLDLVILKYAIRVNGLTEICLTKLDVLDGLDEIKVCTHYKTKEGDLLEEFPLDLDVYTQCEPVYETLPGWKEDISQMTDMQELPQNAQDYVDYIANKTGVKISMVSVGTRRRQTIHLIQLKS
ncbi:adenylosuccinate synthase [Candidatus Marinamargulisbacteria bacterium SCGC AG-343-D04]|nr:adenylosuccinate synthase [Candidatus Marinamargulisbacteria bacterium SCGC AG-343-D04]